MLRPVLGPVRAEVAPPAPARDAAGSGTGSGTGGRVLRWGLPLLLVCLGALLRVRQWAGGRSFWLDELFIVEQVTVRSYGVLATEPLARRQSAPVGWLWLERLSYDLFGDSELALRLPSLLLGIAALVLVWRLGLRVLPPGPAAAAVALTALAPALVRYSNEVKQYPVDVAMVLAVLLLALRVPANRLALRPLLALAALGAAAVWLSVASVFALGAVSVVLVVDGLRRRDLRAAIVTAAALTPWVASLGVAYVTVLRQSRENTVLYQYWAFTFPDERGLGTWLQDRAAALLANPLHLDTHAALAGALLLGGAVALTVRQPRGAAAVLGTAALGALAAAAGVYPLAERLALWLVPLAGLLLASLLPGSLAGPAVRRVGLAAATAVLLVVTAGPFQTSLRSATHTLEVEEMRDLLRDLRRLRQPGDRVVAASSGSTGMAWYGRRTGVTADGELAAERPRPGEACDDGPALRAAGFVTDRVWVVVRVGSTEHLPNGPLRAVRPRIETVASQVRRIERPGVYAVLFAPTAARPADRATFCLEFFGYRSAG